MTASCAVDEGRGRTLSEVTRLGDAGVVHAPDNSHIQQPARLPHDLASPRPGTVRMEAGAEPAVRLQLLGAPELQRAIPLRFAAERRFRLVAFLAMRGDWVSRDELATLFWPDRSQEAARSNLRKLLLEVRALELPQVESERSAMRWAVATDVADFRVALQRGDANAALALYRGPTMQGLDGGDSVAFSAWLTVERARLHAAWRDAATAALSQRDPAGVLEVARSLLDDDPYDEDAMVAALDAYHAQGDAVGAAAAFRGYAEQLIEGLGVEPSARVRAAAARAVGPVGAAATPRRRSTDATAAPVASAAVVVSVLSESFIGRAQELDELSALLRSPECRLLTVTGPGGIGKSSLAKQVVRRLEAQYEDGSTWIALDDLTDVVQVAPRLASALGVEPAPQHDPVERSSQHLASRHTLLVFDNAEHLPRLAALIERLLSAAPRLQVLITSRTRIGAAGEWLVPLAGLALPPANVAPLEMTASAAVQLFVAQARATDPRFNAAANATHIAALVRAVAGLPLAILLAAGWVRLLPMAELAADAARSLDVLERAEEGDERPEHRSVRATFERSWSLASPQEQQALAALSAFVGSFTRALARNVAEAPLPLLAALVDKSLVVAQPDGRFALHPLIQQFAAEKLAQQPSRAEAVRDRHADAFGRFMEPYASFDTADQTAALKAISAELPNLLAAWDWAVRRQRHAVLRAATSGLSNYFQNRGPVAQGAELFERAQAAVESAQPPDPATLWPLALERAALNYWLADYREVEAAARQALAAARAVSHQFALRASLNTLGLALMRLGRLPEAARNLEEALKRARAARVAWEIAGYAGNLVAIKREAGDLVGARAMAQEALAGHRVARHRQGEVSMYNELGMIAHDLDHCAEAIDWYEQGLGAAQEYGLELRTVQLLSHQASACVDLRNVQRARQLADRALELVTRSSMHANEPICRRVLALIEMASGNCPAARRQLQYAIDAACRIGTALVAGPVLRDCALWLEGRGDGPTALTLVAAADAHRISQALLLPRYRHQRARLADRLGAQHSAQAEQTGAALSLVAALDLARQAVVSPD